MIGHGSGDWKTSKLTVLHPGRATLRLCDHDVAVARRVAVPAGLSCMNAR
jgi:hypothetical protein